MVFIYLHIYWITFKCDEELCNALEASYWSIPVYVVPNLAYQDTSKVCMMIYFEMQVIYNMGS